MTEANSFDIMLLGLEDPSSAGQIRYANVMERLTGRPGADFTLAPGRPEEPIFKGLDIDTAQMVVDSLGEAGTYMEVRRSTDSAGEVHQQVVASSTCPQCGFVQPAGTAECVRCGLVFAKYDKELIDNMQKGGRLEEALSKALQSREEWNQKASVYLETHPLQQGATDGFDNILLRDEIPFLRLVTDEGPILMTSRRLICSLEEGFFSIPYEMINDVTVGGGLVQKKSKVRLVLAFHTPMPAPVEPQKQSTWLMNKDSSFYKDVIMDWCYSRNFVCGGCGQRDLDYRLEGATPHTRCMHCATDHEIDVRESIAVPLGVE